jgi:hypothetical protein
LDQNAHIRAARIQAVFDDSLDTSVTKFGGPVVAVAILFTDDGVVSGELERPGFSREEEMI